MGYAGSIRVIAIDPGITTGYALGVIDKHAGKMEVATGQRKMDVTRYYEWLGNIEPDVVICERFEYRNSPRAGLELFSRELIGITTLWAGQHITLDMLFMQMPGSVINGYFDRKKLIELNLWKPGHLHANEACMHLMHWYTFGAGYRYNKIGIQPA